MTDEHIFRAKYAWEHWWQLTERLVVFLVTAFMYVMDQESRRELLSIMTAQGNAFDPQGYPQPYDPAMLVFVAIMGALTLMGMARFLMGEHIRKLSYDNDGLWLHRGLGKRLLIPEQSIVWDDGWLALGRRYRFGLEHLESRDELKGFLSGYGALAPEHTEPPQSEPSKPKKLLRWHGWGALLSMALVVAVLALLVYPWKLNLTTQTLWIIDGGLGAAACVNLALLVRKMLVS